MHHSFGKYSKVWLVCRFQFRLYLNLGKHWKLHFVTEIHFCSVITEIHFCSIINIYFTHRSSLYSCRHFSPPCWINIVSGTGKLFTIPRGRSSWNRQ